MGSAQEPKLRDVLKVGTLHQGTAGEEEPGCADPVGALVTSWLHSS